MSYVSSATEGVVAADATMVPICTAGCSVIGAATANTAANAAAVRAIREVIFFI
jgi:hypothetical protein